MLINLRDTAVKLVAAEGDLSTPDDVFAPLRTDALEVYTAYVK